MMTMTKLEEIYEDHPQLWKKISEAYLTFPDEMIMSDCRVEIDKIKERYFAQNEIDKLIDEHNEIIKSIRRVLYNDKSFSEENQDKVFGMLDRVNEIIDELTEIEQERTENERN